MVAPAAFRLPLPHQVEQRTVHVYAALAALRAGQMKAEQFDMLADFFDWFRHLGELKTEKGGDGSKLIDGARTAMVALANIRDRWEETGRIGASGDELQALGVIAEQMEDAMRRTLMGTLNDAYHRMVEERKKMQEAQKQDLAYEYMAALASSKPPVKSEGSNGE